MKTDNNFIYKKHKVRFYTSSSNLPSTHNALAKHAKSLFLLVKS
ncbi:hypothetical protein vBKpnSKpLi5_25 [Klebsiella phage vB_KpnS_KpLi5]|nr:hypothetical protein vBKpnSKpLi5_25 [Klebsiella phage vB_KpnS_KpLi5]